MSERSGAQFEEPTADGILDDMLGKAIGLDEPMTDEAVVDGAAIVQSRLDRAAEIVGGAHLEPGEEYDSEAVAALFLIGEEREAQAE